VLGGLGLGSLTGLLGGAGIAAAVGTVGRLAVEMGSLGEQVQRSETYFRTFSGSAEAASANLQAVQQATDGALSSQAAMQAATKLLSMGLATNAEELAKISRMAVLLGGDTRNASEAINEFSLLLANQSILRLDTFGISGAKVRERIDELTSSTAGLSREAAFMQAVMEEGTRKVNDLEAANVTAGTSTDRLQAATANLKASLAELVAQPYTVTVNMVTEGVNVLDSIVSGSWREDTEAPILLALDRVKQAEAELKVAKEERAAAGREGLSTELMALYEQAVRDAEAALKGANAELGVAQAAARPTTSSMLDLADAYTRVADEANAAAAAQAAQAAAPRTAGYDNTARIAQGYAYQSEAERNMEEYLRKRHATQRAEEERTAAASLRLAQSTANKAASAWESAFQRVSGRISGYLSQGMSQAEGLFDLTPDLMQPGSNGPFENLFRTLDVAKLGGASPWAAQLGLTQEEARKIGADFQRGIFSPEVIGLVDVNALINEAQMAQLAEKSKEAFANAIAQRAGVGTNVVSALFGLGGGSTGPGQGGNGRTLVDSAMNQVAGVLGESVKAEDFAGRVTGYGEMIWGYFETGIVGKAQNSTALQRAIAAMVSAAIGGQGGGVGATVRGAGGQ